MSKMVTSFKNILSETAKQTSSKARRSDHHNAHRISQMSVTNSTFVITFNVISQLKLIRTFTSC